MNMFLVFFTALCLVVTSGIAKAQINAPTLTAQGSPITLSWTDNSDNEVEFVLEGKVDPSPTWAVIALVHWNTTSYVDRQTGAGHYTYRVKARNFAGESAYSNEAAIDFVPIVPAAPVVTVTTLSIGGGFLIPVLSWKIDPNAIAVHIDRKAPNTNFQPQPDTAASAGMWHDHKVITDRQWCYRMRFANLVGDSVYSNVACTP